MNRRTPGRVPLGRARELHARRANAGFTLIELIATVMILAVLGGVAAGKFFDYRQKAQRSAEDATVASIRAGISQTILANAAGGTPGIPQTLDSAPVGAAASLSNSFFDSVLNTPVQSGWTKTAINVYQGPTGTSYTYDPTAGSFTSGSAAAQASQPPAQPSQPTVSLTTAGSWTAGSPSSPTLGAGVFVGAGYVLTNGVVELQDPTSSFSNAGRRNAVTGTQISAGTFELQLDTRLTNYWNQLNYWQVYLVKSGTTMNLSGNNFGWGAQPTGTKLVTKDYAPDTKSDGSFYSYTNAFTVSAADAAAYDQIVVVMSGTTNAGQVLSWRNVTINKK